MLKGWFTKTTRRSGYEKVTPPITISVLTQSVSSCTSQAMRVHNSYCLLMLLVAAGVPQSWGLMTELGARFVSKGFPLVEVGFVHSCGVSPSYGFHPSRSIALHAKKKKASQGASKKIQVKLTKHVAGTGQAGDVIQVTPAFFNNKLRSTGSAVMISDEEVAKEEAEAAAQQAETSAKVTELKQQITDMTLTICRKAGPDGQLFGGVGAKVIMAELQKESGDVFFGRKGVKVAELMDEHGKKIRGDIKHTGQFGARIILMKDVSAKVSIVIEADA